MTGNNDGIKANPDATSHMQINGVEENLKYSV